MSKEPRVAERDKLHVFERIVQTALSRVDLADAPKLGFMFAPLALDTLDAFASNVIENIKKNA